MSKITKNFLALMLFVTTLIMFSCAKDGADGQPGAAGLNGVNGANGKDGAAGTAGTPGKDGNANVKSRVVTVNASDWIKSFYGTSTTQYYYRVNLPIPEVTKEILDKGLVMTYRSNSSSNANSFISLPFTSAFSAGTSTFITTWTPVHYEGGVTIWKEDSDLLTLEPTGGYTFKVVAITPSGLAAHPNVNYKNYAEVAATFNLD